MLFYLTAIPYGIFQLNWQRFFFSLVQHDAVSGGHLSSLPKKTRAWPLPQELTLATALLFAWLFLPYWVRKSRVLQPLCTQNEELKVALKQIEELAITDELTGLYNRRFCRPL